MYEENNHIAIDWKPVIIKAIITIIVLILVIFIIKSTILNTSNKDTDKTNDLYYNNLNEFKLAALNYYEKENLPKKIGESSQTELRKFIESNLIEDFTNEGQSCNLENSYAKVTKTNGENFSLKVQLQCANNEEYIVTNINL